VSPDAGAIARLTGIEKRFGTTLALDGADLALRPGEVHGVLGENGAGKTTLLEVLGGLLRPDAGTVEVGGRSVRMSGARDAWRLGVGMVHQHFTLVPRLSVLENLALGIRTRARGLGLPFDSVRRRTASLVERTGLEVDLGASVEDLGVGARQRVEILKVLLRDPEVLVLDEPTAVLAPLEVDRLLGLLRSLADDGKAVVLVAHKLDEVLGVADRVTVLRGGRTVLTASREDVDAASLTRAMVGAGEPGVDARRREGDEAPPGEVVARLEGVGLIRPHGARLDDVSLTVHRGEIVGIAGVEGNGQRELALVLAARRLPDEGRVDLPADPGFIPQDRRREGLVLDFDLAENLALGLHRDPALRAGPFLRWAALRRRAADRLRRFDVRAPGPATRARTLSGGNQQRVVVARELERSADLLVAENPTRGLDVAGTAYVRERLASLRDLEPSPGVVLLSTDLDEVLELADRLFVMVRGRLLPVPAERRDRDGVGALMLGGES
jgi:simple sugar transport system ATP-binding protein